MSKQIFKSRDLKTLFNLAYAGVVGQGKASVIPNPNNLTATTCAYQSSDDDCRCAVGWCLTDEALDKVSSFVGSVDAVIMDFTYDGGFETDDIDGRFEDYLMELQEIHDTAESEVGDGADDVFIEKFKNDMMVFAAKKFPERIFDYKHGIL